jgi:hypothetical protein
VKIFVLSVTLAMVLGVPILTSAALVDNGGGLIYDTDLNITWYDTASFGGGNWDAAMAWVAGLKAGGVSGWRLPTTPGGAWPAYLGEMGHLYYDELKNTTGGPLTNTGPFVNLSASDYWSGTEYALNTDYAWDFYFYAGGGGATIKTNTERALAVHDGNVVPIPGAIFLLGPGLLGLAAVRRRFKK